MPEDNGLGGLSGPGVHPFIMVQTKNKDFMGIFFLATTP